MKVCFLGLGILLFLAGCSSPRPAAESREKGSAISRTARDTNVLVTPNFAPVGQVTMVNRGARFVVISYSLGSVPAAGQRLAVYRQNIKVGELKVSGPQQDFNTVADLVSGEANLNDEVRSE